MSRGETVRDAHVLEINNVHVDFFTDKGTFPVVDGVDIVIPKGKSVGLVGESGCGKSMTAMSIMGLVQRPGKVTEGEIRFDGKNLLELSQKKLRTITGDRISVVFQEPMTALNPVTAVGKQVAEAIILHQKVSKREAKAKTIEIFQRIGIPDPEKRYKAYPHELSGGLRQRVMIGMAMVCNPDLLIADEPTTALDVTIEAQILRLMRKLQTDNQTSILMITHNFGVVAEVCDYVYVMYAGKVMEYANVFHLFERPSHPYTTGLLNSLPQIGDRQDRLSSIRGTIPDLMNLPRGCRFCTRCDQATQRCFEESPELYDIGDGHLVRCFLYEEGGRSDD